MRRFWALLLGLCATFFLLELGLWLFADRYVSSQLAVTGADTSTTRTVLAVGESTTAIAGDPTHARLVSTSSWPQQLEQILNERTEDNWRVINRAVLGGTSNEIVDRLKPDLDQYRPDVVVAMMGMQDESPRRVERRDRSEPKRTSWWTSLRTVRLFYELSGSPFLSQEDYVPGDVSQWSDIPHSFRDRVIEWRPMAQETRLLGATSEVMSRVDLGLYFWLVGQPDRAETIWRQLFDTQGIGANLLARVMLDRGDQAGAEAFLREAMKRTPDEGLYAVVLSGALVGSGQLTAAIELLESAIRKHCREREVVRKHQYLALAVALIEAEQPLEAREALRHVGQIDTRRLQHLGPTPEPPLLHAKIELALGRVDAAQQGLESFLQRKPGFNEAMVMLEKIYLEKGETDRAMALRQELLFKRRRVAEFYLLAKLKKRMGQTGEVESIFHNALKEIPLAVNYERLYQTSKASGAEVFAVQYPTFELDLLRLYVPEHADLHLVDTEHIFDNLPAPSVFVEPRFPYNFAHYTHEGARLLAERIASELIELPQPVPL